MRLQRCLPVLATSVVLLSGCGVAGTEFHPGIAAEVGDETITSRHVEDLSQNYCTALEQVSKQDPQSGFESRSMRAFSSEVLGNLVNQAVAERLADDYDVTPSPSYKGNLAELDTQLVGLDEDEQDAVREIFGARSYSVDVLLQIGGLELAKQGNDDSTDDDKYAAGQELVRQWATDHDVEINPKYVVSLGDAPVDDDLSFAVSGTAKGGLAGEPDTSYANALPSHLVCLD